ncbi:MAG: hypothetical protein HON04_06345, partial [Planctomicrobium sp.]|nr:hypothetical protein [Planctomicrobium sp.]
MPASEQYWRSLPQMHKVFAASAILLLGVTLLMMYKDESRSWKQYQIQGEKYRLEKIQEGMQEINTAEYQEKVAALESRINDLQSVWDNRSEEVVGMQRKLVRLEGQVQIQKAESKSKNAS